MKIKPLNKQKSTDYRNGLMETVGDLMKYVELSGFPPVDNFIVMLQAFEHILDLEHRLSALEQANKRAGEMLKDIKNGTT